LAIKQLTPGLSDKCLPYINSGIHIQIGIVKLPGRKTYEQCMFLGVKSFQVNSCFAKKASS